MPINIKSQEDFQSKKSKAQGFPALFSSLKERSITVKRISALVLCMILLLTSCSHKIYNPEIDGAKYLTELLSEDIEEPAMYSFCGNILVCGNGKILIISPKTGKILKKQSVESSLVAYVGNETFVLKFTDSFIVYDKDLKEIKRYECDN